MAKSEKELSLLIDECCDVFEEETPLYRVMPYFDSLGLDWCLPESEVPNSYIRDNFQIFSDIKSRRSYAILSHTGGLFPQGKAFLPGGYEIDVPNLGDKSKKSLAGYCWEENGRQYWLSNESTLEDGINDAASICDDWLFGAFFFMDFESDGSLRSPDESLPDVEEIEKAIFELGGKRSDPVVKGLENQFLW